jgi:hypothetical protein
MDEHEREATEIMLIIKLSTLSAYQDAEIVKKIPISEWPTVLIEVCVPPLFEEKIKEASNITGVPRITLETLAMTNLALMGSDALREELADVVLSLMKDPTFKNKLKLEAVGDYVKVIVKGRATDE